MANSSADANTNSDEIVAAQEDVAMAAKEEISSVGEQVSAIAQHAKKVATDVQKDVADKIAQLNKHLKELELQEKAIRGLKRVGKFAEKQYEKTTKQITTTKEYLYKQLIKNYKKPNKNNNQRKKN